MVKKKKEKNIVNDIKKTDRDTHWAKTATPDIKPTASQIGTKTRKARIILWLAPRRCDRESHATPDSLVQEMVGPDENNLPPSVNKQRPCRKCGGRKREEENGILLEAEATQGLWSEGAGAGRRPTMASGRYRYRSQPSHHPTQSSSSQGGLSFRRRTRRFL